MRFVVFGMLGGIAYAVAAAFAGRAADPDYEMFLGFASMAGIVVGALAGLTCWLCVALVGDTAFPRRRVAAAVIAGVTAAAWMLVLITTSGAAPYALITAAVAIPLAATLAYQRRRGESAETTSAEGD